MAGLPQGAHGSGVELGQRFRHTMKGATSPAFALQVYFALVACGHCDSRLRLASAPAGKQRIIKSEIKHM